MPRRASDEELLAGILQARIERWLEQEDVFHVAGFGDALKKKLGDKISKKTGSAVDKAAGDSDKSAGDGEKSAAGDEASSAGGSSGAGDKVTRSKLRPSNK